MCTKLISDYNQADSRFHKIGCFLRREKPDQLTFYALQLMLLTYMQHFHQMVALQDHRETKILVYTSNNNISNKRRSHTVVTLKD